MTAEELADKMDRYAATQGVFDLSAELDLLKFAEKILEWTAPFVGFTVPSGPTLPLLPSPEYRHGSWFISASDGNVYENVSDVWTLAWGRDPATLKYLKPGYEFFCPPKPATEPAPAQTPPDPAQPDA
jgi:hypothetical protein